MYLGGYRSLLKGILLETNEEMLLARIEEQYREWDEHISTQWDKKLEVLATNMNILEGYLDRLGKKKAILASRHQ